MNDDQRVADLQAEYAKHLESWNRTRERLTRERELLLWLHAEAVWSREQAILDEALSWRKLVEQWERSHQDEVLPYTAKLEAEIEAARAKVAEVLGWFERERSSRQAWAEEALRLDHELELMAGFAGLESSARRRVEFQSEQLRALAQRLVRLDDPTDESGVEDRRTITLNTIVEAARRALDATDPQPSRPQCTVHPEPQAWEQLPLFDIPQKEES